jgi:hypothetical protein
MSDAADLVDQALGAHSFTEDAIASRFSEAHAHDLRYVALKGQWYHWDASRWRPEHTLLAFDLIRTAIKDAAAGSRKAAPEKIFSAKTVGGVHALVRADRRQATTVEQWDAKDLAFNTEEESTNGDF